MADEIREWLKIISDPSVFPFNHNNNDKISKSAVVIDPTKDFKAESVDDEGDFSYRGQTDGQGRFHHGGTLTFANGDVIMCDFHHGVRQGNLDIYWK